jgi:hypothetical protein
MSAIYKREMRAYFTSPIGYIFVAIFFALSGFVFSFTTISNGTTDSSNYFATMIVFFVILIPLLTMKLLSEERKLKTEQILLTAPVSLIGIIGAKFLAAYTIFAGSFLGSSLVNFSVLGVIASKEKDVIDKLSFPTIFGNVVGILLIGGAFIAIGLFLSAITENQLIAAISAIGVFVLIFVLSILPNKIGNETLRIVVKWLSLFTRFNSFSYGIFDLTSIIYYFSIIVIFLFMTVRVYEKRRWA